MWFTVTALAASPAETWAAHAAEVARVTPVPVRLTDADIAALLEGKVVARRTDSDTGAFATGAILVQAPIEAVWIAIQDGPHDPESRVRATWLAGSPPGVRWVYGHLDLPWPVADRQWVLEMRNNPELFRATGGAVWQRTWGLTDPARAPSPDAAAEWVTDNRGAWTLLETDAGTIALFSVRTVLGGMLPTSITSSWAVSSLRGSLAHLADLAHGMRAHYGASHDRVLTPSGEAIASIEP